MTTMSQRSWLLVCTALNCTLVALVLSAGGSTSEATAGGKAVQSPTQEVLSKGKPVGFWVKQLGDTNTAKRMEAAEALEALGKDAKSALPALKAAVKER